jgi:hypothetical protein
MCNIKPSLASSGEEHSLIPLLQAKDPIAIDKSKTNLIDWFMHKLSGMASRFRASLVFEVFQEHSDVLDDLPEGLNLFLN